MFIFGTRRVPVREWWRIFDYRVWVVLRKDEDDVV